MENPREGRVAERHFLNLPGFHERAYVVAYVSDTSEAEVAKHVPHPQLQLQIADCFRHVELHFCVANAEERLNSFHKIDTLIAALEAFREGMAAEAALHRRRARALTEKADSGSEQ